LIFGFDGVADLVDEKALHSFEELTDWLKERKEKQYVYIDRIPLEECSPWFYDDRSGQIRNRQGTFFQISGLRGAYPDGTSVEQPIILQKEIGYLGIICKRFHGVWHFLMQAKIEPGNINYVQISPTIQATKSNFTRQHGGREPAYLRYFTHMKPEDILVDQIQSEQSSRFLGKRNRNVIIKTEDALEETDSHRWMTLNQLRQFMRYDNLINMDTRTVLSCLPYVFMSESLIGYSGSFIRSLRSIDRETVVDIYTKANDIKMFHSPQVSVIPLRSLKNWRLSSDCVRHKTGYPFEVIFCKLEIEGREVTRWNQPLFAALGIATFGLICCEDDGITKVLVKLKPEIGCFDVVELGPSVQEEYGSLSPRDNVARVFFHHLEKNETVMDVIMSEEGGRFYHEQNRNVIIYVKKDEFEYDRERYVWASVGTLNALTQINNCLNIQLRNLLMLLSMKV
jgi:NDP-hexose 2,3-dehydratase.